MLFGAHITDASRRVPDGSCVLSHLLGGHADRRIVVGNLLLWKNLLIGDSFLQSGSIDESILGTIAFGHYGNNSKHIAIGMYVRTFLGFQANGVVDWLVANNFVGTDVNETDRFRSCDDSSHLLVEGKLFHLFV